jgi:hypothetical protein
MTPITPLFGGMLWLALFARAIDLGTTFLVLSAGGRETNRVVRWMFRHLGHGGTAGAQLALVIAFAFSLRFLVGDTWASVGLGLVALQGFLLGIHNERVLSKLKERK